MATIVLSRRAQSQVEGQAIDQKHSRGINICAGYWEVRRQDTRQDWWSEKVFLRWTLRENGRHPSEGFSELAMDICVGGHLASPLPLGMAATLFYLCGSPGSCHIHGELYPIPPPPVNWYYGWAKWSLTSLWLQVIVQLGAASLRLWESSPGMLWIVNETEFLWS